MQMEKDGFREYGEMINCGKNKVFVAQCTRCKEEKAHTSPGKRDDWEMKHRKKCRS